VTSREVFIVDGLRTPRGKASPRGALASHSALDLARAVLAGLRDRAPALPALTEDVILGCATQVDEQGTNLARTAVLLEHFGDHVPGLMVNRFCASGIEAVNLGAARIMAGQAGLLVAGGVESVSRVPMFSDRGPLYTDPAVMRQVGTVHMGISADFIATREAFSREALDAYALRTREKARAADRAGRGRASVLPLRRDDGTIACDRDELLGFAPTASDLAALPPAFQELGAQGQDAVILARNPEVSRVEHLHTRASSPPLADAAAMLVLADEEGARRCGLRPRARIVRTASVAVDPVVMLTAGQLATERVLAREGLAPDDVAVFEFAEAFSALSMRFQRDLGIDDARLNPNGGTLALGHAFGATGAILLLNAVDELERVGGRYAVAAVSGAAGLGTATLLELTHRS
jgi:acetyl-CoA C-acetyltransferase